MDEGNYQNFFRFIFLNFKSILMLIMTMIIGRGEFKHGKKVFESHADLTRANTIYGSVQRKGR